jgi:hypothetical protein
MLGVDILHEVKQLDGDKKDRFQRKLPAADVEQVLLSSRSQNDSTSSETKRPKARAAVPDKAGAHP